MKRTTKKLSGIGLELFLRRFYGKYANIDDALARQLSQDGAKTFASVRVRRIAWRDWRPQQNEPATTAGTPSPARNEPAGPETTSAAPSPQLAAVTDDAGSDAPFDPYAIGLVPIYQREGAEGLSQKLAVIGSLDNLRKMARSQQVALPAELRGSDADIAEVRAAIVNAVGKRIANRRAAAG